MPRLRMSLYSAILFIVLFIALSTGVVHAAEKRVCNCQMDRKTGKQIQVCKVIKIHKKLEVTSR